MYETYSLSNQFLIAMPQLADPNFEKSVMYICSHSEVGAMAIVINQPTDITFRELLSLHHANISAQGLDKQTILLGGPIDQEQGFVLHQPAGDWEYSLKVSDDIALSSSKDIFSAIAAGKGPSKTLIAFGYAGWEAGQLEEEMASNTWLNSPVDASILFDLPYEQRWTAAVALLGINVSNLSQQAGHA